MSEDDPSGNTSNTPKGRSQEVSEPAGVSSTPRIRPCTEAVECGQGGSQSANLRMNATNKQANSNQDSSIRKAHKPTQGTFRGHLAQVIRKTVVMNEPYKAATT